MDPYLRLPPTLWTGTLRQGFVGCLKDLFVNGASHDVVTYAHQQDVGESLNLHTCDVLTVNQHRILVSNHFFSTIMSKNFTRTLEWENNAHVLAYPTYMACMREKMVIVLAFRISRERKKLHIMRACAEISNVRDMKRYLSQRGVPPSYRTFLIQEKSIPCVETKLCWGLFCIHQREFVLSRESYIAFSRGTFRVLLI